MTNYVFTYHGGAGMPETQEEQDKLMAAWGAWFEQMGDKVVDGGNPFTIHRTVAADGSVSDGGPAAELGGYSVITADSFDDAVTIAKGCPVLEGGGQVQVSETIEM
ncbi:MAG: YciI family protein [Actinomycetota bacterium]